MTQPWAQGDYARVAEVLLPASALLAERAAIGAGDRVLDVAAGTGNLAMLAAQAGADVVACDITPALIDVGRARCTAAGLAVEWVEADAQGLPLPDDAFDTVASVFGAIFAPDPQRAAAELFRVARPGGTVALTAWVPEGWNGAFMRLLGEVAEAPPGAVPPPQWGVEEVLRERLSPYAATLEVSRHAISWPAATPDELVAFLEEAAPPLAAARAALSPERYAQLRADMLAAFGEDGAAPAPYLLAVASLP